MIRHAEYELNLLLSKCEDEEERILQKEINNNALEIVKKFCEVGHSGFSAEYEIEMIIKLLRQQNLTPLTLKDDEFVEVSDGVFQNIRDSRVFKQMDRFGFKPYNVDTMEVLEGDNNETSN